MLSVARVSVHQGRHYYTRDNYYANETGVEQSAWWGEGARLLGLDGKVDARAFQALLEGYDPSRNHVLSGRRIEKNHRAGLDMTFSAPKSVSLAALVGGNADLEAAHHMAVETALSVIQERYAMARSGGPQDRKIEVTGNLVVARFSHDTSRSKDPQLHTHCVAINTTRRADGKWRALYDDNIFDESKLLGMIYQDALLREVRRLGYEVSLNRDGTFEVVGYSQEQREAFSKRYLELKEAGLDGHRKEDRAEKLRRRSPKGPEIPRGELLEQWQKEAQGVGIKAHPAPAVRPARELTEDERRRAALELVRSSATHNTERDVAFRREKLEAFALEKGLGRISWEDLQAGIKAAEASGLLLSTRDGRLTTAEALRLETEMTAMLRAGAGRFQPISSPGVIRELVEDGPGRELSPGQKEAVTLTLSTEDQFVAWQGVAGAGKTFALSRLRPLAEAAGLAVKGFAPSAEAAKVLEGETGIETQTVAAHLVQTAQRAGAAAGKSQGSRRELWFVDEAGLLSSRDAKALMAKARAEGARVIFVGDRRQLSGVEAGNPFKLLQEKGIATAHLTESRRQKRALLKESVALLAQGLAREGLTKLRNLVKEFRKEETRTANAAREYLVASKAERDETLVVAGTNRERQEITRQIRDGLKAEGSLAKETSVEVLRTKDLTREELAYAAHFAKGDVVVFHKSYKKAALTKGEQYEVAAADVEQNVVTLRDGRGRELTFDPKKLTRKNLYGRETLELAEGDLLKWTKNDHAEGRRNGQEFRIRRIEEGRAEIEYKGGVRAEIDLRRPVHLDHNYVTTTYSSQGKTKDRVVIATDRTFGKEAMYVALSRARYDVKVFTEDKENMVALAERSTAKLTAEELLAPLEAAREKLRLELADKAPELAPTPAEGLRQAPREVTAPRLSRGPRI
jgi:conjugative relaxase-like TrwC/TraI family protein